MKKGFIIILMLLIMACGRIEYSEIKSEEAKVVEKVYIPQYTYTTLESRRCGDHTIWYTDVHIRPEHYGVKFLCKEHSDVFEFSSRSLYDRVKEGEKVILDYVDVIRITNEGKEDEKKEIINQHTLRIIFNNGDIILRHINDDRFKHYYTAKEVSVLMKSLTNQ